MMSPSQPRPCQYYDADKKVWNIGRFHAWTIQCSFSVYSPAAIVEDEGTGKIKAYPLAHICFTTVPPTIG